MVSFFTNLHAKGEWKVVLLLARCFQKTESDQDLLFEIWPPHGVPVSALLYHLCLLWGEVE